jgi:Sulfotransferase family
MVKLQSPIITIGAGRSGSTLLHRILNHHPKVVFFNENSFLAPRLWLELWKDRFWFTSEQFVAQQPRSALDPLPAVDADRLEQEQQRIGALIATLIADVLGLDRKSCTIWGYKEIWNGSSQFDYPWEDYDQIFPGAFWLHLIRNPCDFARSTARWNRDPLTLDYMKERLTDWVAILEKSRQRSTTGRYREVRYEDLVADPQDCLTPVFEANDLRWHDDCLQALGRFSMKSSAGSPKSGAVVCDRQQLTALCAEVDGLERWMQEYDYTLPSGFETLIEEAPADAKRPSFAELNLITEDELASQKHQPQHLLQQRLHQTASDLRREWLEEVGALHRKMQKQHADWQEKWQLEHETLQAEQQKYLTAHNKYLAEHENYLRERENFLNERKRHFIFYFFVRRYHELRALMEKIHPRGDS